MKKLAFLIIILISVAAQAQDYYFETQSEANHWNERSGAEHQRRIDNHITAMKVYSIEPNASAGNQGVLSSESAFDARGNTIDTKMYKKNGKLKYRYSYNYSDQNKKTEEIGYKSNGKLEYKSAWVFNAAGHVTDERFFYHSPDYMTWHSMTKYDEKENMLELKYLTRNDTKLYDRYEYSYYQDGSRKQTVQYNRKGKVLHTWNYNCNPAGNLDRVKDSSKVCIRYETDKDGNKIKIKEENGKWGKIVRYVTRSDKNDNVVDVLGYNTSGKPVYHYTAKYDEKNNRTEYAFYKGVSNKLKEHGILHYDASGNMTDHTSYKNAADQGKVYKLVYTKG